MAFLLVAVGCGSGGSEAEGADGDLEGPSVYAEQVEGPLNRLGTSATRMGVALLSASESEDLVKVRRTADSQIRLVSQIQSRIGALTPGDGDAQDHRRLRNAVSLERQYLGRLVRITSGSPERGLSQLPATRALGERMIEAYRGFYRGAPDGIPQGVTDAGLLDLSGVRLALQDAVAENQAEEAASTRSAPAPLPSPVYPRGPVVNEEAEADRIFRNISRGDYSDLGAAETLFSQLQGTSDPLRGNAAFNLGILRYAAGDCSGAVSAFGYAASVSGNATQNAIRQRVLDDASQTGCGIPVASLIG
ncbi:hypothetical protein [Miltoncostaea oceani]|uniref:hypothetical protein n=1 Tax=Miltoncostaea oceani TaxID=2843216 RepID=UPI001C3DAC59|nr:hypothetical protein [Miltoncostaea oceani]